MSETCRVIIKQVKQKLHLVGYLLTLYQHVWGVYGLWGGGGARSRFVLEKGLWTGAVLGIVLNYHSCLLTAMSISGLHF